MAIAGISLTRTLVFNTAGTTAWVAPADVTSIKVEALGGGGAGGERTTNGLGGGGGGGEYAAEPALAVTPGTSYNVVVGAAGSGVTAGGNSTFNATGVVAHGGSTPALNTTTGAAGGTGSSNTTHHDGGAGGTAATSSGGGGSGAGTGVVGNTASGATGGAATDVGGAGANGISAQGNGTTGTSPGGGGSGGDRTSSGTRAGGGGGLGWVRLTFTSAYYWDWTSSGSGLKTLAVSPTAIGDVIAFVGSDTSNVNATGITAISGGGVTTWNKLIGDNFGSGSVTGGVEIWWGVVTSTGAATITITAANWGNINILLAKQFTGGSAGTWTADSATGSSDESFTFAAPTGYPSITPTTANAELFIGAIEIANTIANGTTAGFFYQLVSGGITSFLLAAYHTSAPSPSAPNAGTSAGGSWIEVDGFLIFTPTATSLPTQPLIAAQAVQRAASW